MNAELSERDKDTDKQGKEGGESKNQGRYNREYEKCMTESTRERKVMVRGRGERKHVLDERRGKKVQNVLWGEKDNRAYVEWMYRGMERSGEKY
jgi:hypothetical protein